METIYPELAESHPLVVAEVMPFFDSINAYLSPEEVRFVASAFKFAEAAHAPQWRQSGEPYITHPIAVATILTQWHLDAQSLSAALMHDVMEDAGISKWQLAERFGKSVSELVDGLSKLEKLESQSREEAQAENFRKMLLAMARDPRIILIKLADRLHNMRTLDAMKEEKRVRIARETMDIYANIANRIGLHTVYQELEDLSFSHLSPYRYGVLTKAIRNARRNRRENVSRILEEIQTRLKEADIPATISGREKHLHSIFKKMQEAQMSFSEVLDVYGFRVIVKTIPECYLVLGMMHGLYRPKPGLIKDYIAIPKENGYQSLHTTLISPYTGDPIEIQIRTEEMHHVAEIGVAAHWLYKSGDESVSNVHLKMHRWIQNLLKIHAENSSPSDFLEYIKVDLFPEEVYVFTPQGKIVSLQAGSTAVDFAYSIHTDVGNQCIAAKINHELMPLRTQLKNGDRIEIITSEQAKANPSWLNFVVTGYARSAIRHALKKMQYQESVALGERMLKTAFQTHHAADFYPDEALWHRFLKGHQKALQPHDILAEIGTGERVALVVARRFLALAGRLQGEQADYHPPALAVRRATALYQFGTCCYPIPGDHIVGIAHKDKGLMIHTHDCAHVHSLRATEREHIVDVVWDETHLQEESTELYAVSMRVWVLHERGVLAEITTILSEAGANIDNISMDAEEERGSHISIHFILEVENRVHLAHIMKRIRQTPRVERVHRDRFTQKNKREPTLHD